MPITRVRTGCLTCRRRKKKCDEKKDICGGCRRNSFACEWSQSKSAKRKATRRASTCTTEDAQESQSPKSYNTENDIASTSQSSDQLDNSTIPSDHGVGDDGEPLSTLSLPEVNLLLDSTDGVHAALAEPVEDGEEESVIQETIVTDMIVTPACATEDLTWESYGHRSIPYNIPLLPRLEPTSTSLLSHYLSRTANSMGNGSTDSNPFIVQLIPLAFSSELLLYLLLTQSAEHLAISEQDMPKSTLRMYYGRSIQLFREGLNNYLAGKEDDALILTIGTLVMCLTEVARGDVQGTVFEHLRAAKLLIDHVSSSVTHIPSNLQDFLVEYYTYTSTLSIISMDPASGNNIVLSSNMWDRAQGLVARQYVGSLCGGWLELLLLIPSIFYLDKGSSATEDNVLHRSADDISIFACLQSQIVSFSPHPSLRPKVALASRIYQQAMLLYLLTTLGIPENREGSMHGVLIENTISNAISLLEQLPPTERINTSLCWPLAVIGSCISIKSMQGVLRQRLRVMFDVIGLGNMRETLSLLEELWKLPSNQRSPWTIWKSMQDHHIQISFA